MEEKKLKDICEFIVDCPHSTAKDEGSGYPLIRTPNVGKGRLILQGVHRVNEQVYKTRNERATPSTGDIILAREAPVGNAAIIMPGQKVCLGQRVVLFRVKKEIANPMFLVYYLLSNEVQHKLKNNANGAVVAHLNMDEIRNLAITLPRIDIQNKIAAILSSIDDKIEVNRKINENLEQQAQALFKSWFVDFEPFKNGEFVDSELGMIPKGWRVGTLKEIADIIMGTSPSGSSYNTEGIGDVFYQGRAEFGFRFPKRNMYTTEAKRFAEVDTVLVSVRAPVGNINVAEERCCIGRGLASVKSKNNYNSYILYLMQSLKNVFDRFNGEGTVFGSINKKAFEEMQIIVPTGNVISKFDSIASSMDCQIKRTEQESRRLASLRDTLLPKLMSGEIKVNKYESIVKPLKQ